jgi:two-component system sensor histidine kinase and response regulator WspE
MKSAMDSSLVELFQAEARAQTALLTEQLLALEGEEPTPARLVTLMRAAHSLKGAARIVGRQDVLRVAHAMEDWLEWAQTRAANVTGDHMDVLLRAVDVLTKASAVSDEALDAWSVAHQEEMRAVLAALESTRGGAGAPDGAGVAIEGRVRTPLRADIVQAAPRAHHPAPELPVPPSKLDESWSTTEQRLTGGTLDRLLGLTGEALVAVRTLEVHAADSVPHRRAQHELGAAIDELRDALVDTPLTPRARRALTGLQRRASQRQDLRRKRDVELDAISQRLGGVVGRLYGEVLDSRMRPFEDGTTAFPRMVRDIARELGKDARVMIVGGATLVDREVLRRLDAPLVHLLRNAIDHGIERPEDRRAAQKPDRATITLSARHAGGRLLVIVEDDGSGIHLPSLREAIVAKGLADEAAVAAMSEKEVLEFLFLPGFSLRQEVTALSGRGIGLDAVRATVHDIGGTVRVSTTPDTGTRFELQLPLTLSIVRALIVDIGGQPYAIPLARIRSVLRLKRERIESVEGRQHFSFADRQVGLLWAHQLLGMHVPATDPDEATIVIVDDHEVSYGLAVDRLLAEQEVVLRGLDPQLGKVQNVGAAALLPDGTPVLVFDVDDVVRSVANLLAGSRLDPLRRDAARAEAVRKRVLVVDDSLTVRELERKLIAGRGYEVDVAVDGMDGWNAVRTVHYDLVVTDVDMPRLDGVELIALIRKDPVLRALPVIIVSYKDRDEDRRRGLDAGADVYLTKSSFYDETMLRSVEDLIGAPTS